MCNGLALDKGKTDPTIYENRKICLKGYNMPIFEYICHDCGQEFEELVSSTEESIPCPHCNSEKTEKLMSACSTKVEGALNFDALQGSSCGSGGG